MQNWCRLHSHSIAFGVVSIHRQIQFHDIRHTWFIVVSPTTHLLVISSLFYIFTVHHINQWKLLHFRVFSRSISTMELSPHPNDIRVRLVEMSVTWLTTPPVDRVLLHVIPWTRSCQIWRVWNSSLYQEALSPSPTFFRDITLFFSRKSLKKIQPFFFSAGWPVGHSETKSGWCVLDTRGRWYYIFILWSGWSGGSSGEFANLGATWRKRWLSLIIKFFIPWLSSHLIIRLHVGENGLLGDVRYSPGWSTGRCVMGV